MYLLVARKITLLDQFCDQCCPALVAGAQTSAIVTVEVFGEDQVVTPKRIVLKLLDAPEDRPLALIIPEEKPGQSALEFKTNLP